MLFPSSKYKEELKVKLNWTTSAVSYTTCLGIVIEVEWLNYILEGISNTKSNIQVSSVSFFH